MPCHSANVCKSFDGDCVACWWVAMMCLDFSFKLSTKVDINPSESDAKLTRIVLGSFLSGPLQVVKDC